MEQSFISRADLDTAIRDRIAADPGFRERLVADPKAVLVEIVGMPLPDAVSVTVHEESLTDVHLVLPAGAADELADDDLELVAGGACWGNWISDQGGSFLDFNGNGYRDASQGE